MRILILEDCPERMEQFRKRLQGHYIKDYSNTKNCIEALKNDGPWNYLFLDNDLGCVFENPGDGTGYEVAKFIADNNSLAPDKIIIHSLNNIGALAMQRVLGQSNIKADYIPFLWKKIVI
jgi:hypothetical protein